LSFRRRLTVFFVLIVVVPMIAVAILLVQLSKDSRAGKADARLAANVTTATAVYRDHVDAARRAGRELVAGGSVTRALRSGSPAAARRAAGRAQRQGGLATIVLADTGGETLARAGAPDAVGFASIAVRDGPRRLGSVLASTLPAEAYVAEVRRLTADDVALARGSDQLAASPALRGAAVEPSGDATVGGRELRARSATLPDPEGELVLSILGPRESKGVAGNESLIAIILLAFFALALAFILPLLRDLQSLHDAVAEQAVTDELTGLSNPRRFRELIRKEAGRASRFGRPLSLLMIDLDDFKRVNDEHGHPQGDDVLRAIAEVLRNEARDVDEPARYGGEEFALALPETEAEGALQVAERIRARIEAARVPLARGGGTVSLTTSVGVASTSDGVPADAERLIAAADQALYAAKRAGKNRTERHAHGAPAGA
jgi:diguanylate cyclase (GGDEF)-like protein